MLWMEFRLFLDTQESAEYEPNTTVYKLQCLSISRSDCRCPSKVSASSVIF